MRRGVSTIVGTLLFMTVTVSILSSLILFIQYQNDLLAAYTSMSNKKISQDEIDIITSNYCDTNCKLTVGIYNRSDHDINLLSLWLIDNRTSNVITQRDMTTYIVNKKITTLLNDYVIQSGIYTIKIVTNDGIIKEKIVTIPSLELNLKSIITSTTINRYTILTHITNTSDGAIENINVYISGLGNTNIAIATIDRLERLQSTIIKYDLSTNINLPNNLGISIYAEGRNQLDKIVRSNTETI